jgi:hypothetical protein
MMDRLKLAGPGCETLALRLRVVKERGSKDEA